MGELRLYAMGIDEVRGMFGAHPDYRERLREAALRALTPAPDKSRSGGLLSKLGPIFRRPPASPVVSPTQPTPADLEVLLAGAYVPPDRTGATWRVLETLVASAAWGSTLMPLTPQSLDELDFALARGGVASDVGLRHLLSTPTSVNLLAVHGLTCGWHPYDKALAMTDAYRAAEPAVKSADQRELVGALVRWLEDFPGWAQQASSQGRDLPDLLGFWAN